MKVMIKVPLNAQQGYGNDGIGLALAFRQAGCDVYLEPTAVQTPLPPDVADLLTKRSRPPFDLFLCHLDPGSLAVTPGQRRNSTVTVAQTMWEWTSLKNMDGRSKVKSRLRNFDLVVGYDAVSTGALAPYVSTRAATVQGGYWPDLWPPMRRDWKAPTLNFCMMGDLGNRKNPFVAIEAFQELREEHPELDIALNLKTNSPGLHSKIQDWVPGVRIFYDLWDEQTLRDFYAAQHVLLAPSRGEGKNMPALEFLSSGGTVIATNWGGHTQWLSPSIGYPLDYSLIPFQGQDNLWADADKAHLKKLMLHCATHRDELRRKGELAAELIPQMCSWPIAVDRLMGQVGELGEKGERVLLAYRQAKERVKESRNVRDLVGLL